MNYGSWRLFQRIFSSSKWFIDRLYFVFPLLFVFAYQLVILLSLPLSLKPLSSSFSPSAFKSEQMFSATAERRDNKSFSVVNNWDRWWVLLIMSRASSRTISKLSTCRKWQLLSSRLEFHWILLLSDGFLHALQKSTLPRQSFSNLRTLCNASLSRALVFTFTLMSTETVSLIATQKLSPHFSHESSQQKAILFPSIRSR